LLNGLRRLNGLRYLLHGGGMLWNNMGFLDLAILLDFWNNRSFLDMAVFSRRLGLRWGTLFG